MGCLGGGCIPLGPHLCNLVVLLPVGEVLCGNAADERVRGIAVREQRTDTQQHLRDSEGRAPVVLEDVQADLALAVDVAVVDASLEGHLRRFEGIFS